MAGTAPAWIVTLKSSERSPSQRSAMSRCPVLETGRNSVMPSMMPRITVLRVSDTLLGLARPGMRGRHLNRAPAISQQAGEILQLEAAERGVVAARQRYELERLAHLLRHDEAP